VSRQQDSDSKVSLVFTRDNCGTRVQSEYFLGFGRLGFLESDSIPGALCEPYSASPEYSGEPEKSRQVYLATTCASRFQAKPLCHASDRDVGRIKAPAGRSDSNHSLMWQPCLKIF
jgi:hypothetical protein